MILPAAAAASPDHPYINTTRMTPPPADDPASTSASGRGETVLVVEDDDSVRELAVAILGMAGYRVLAVGSGADALALPPDEQIDLLLTDVIMPGLDGPALAVQLTAARPGLRVVFVSGYPSDMAMRPGATNERATFLQKPYSISQLSATVRAALDG
jgi:two-component system cell cycle sensor histidine kinase/response regulator CckA